ncbi:NgoFVII family restriction endonuclease [Pseudoxanthomonas yeongjuensis]|uniref:helicase-related protein n=1 Tax=Pseudoxanthomonas yeongjuensis TaxID=377616 RepID=UPI001390BDD1|nr:helicase-related protein [Pseudoxanthomonas yeongjuensis]KAF1714444.1 NgoFVII family restriction endonuclease [Pseudoxanthomonas yeongjuensis]
MPRIFDNIQDDLLAALRASLSVSNRADFCVGYLNLRGWQAIDDLVGSWSPDHGQICRVMVGMQRPSHDEIRDLYRASEGEGGLDNASASRLKSQFAAHVREQITLGIPTGKDEHALRRFATQLRAGQVVVKLFLPYPLHAKLYLLFRDDANNPITGFVGSSNLTMQGLSRQGELNVDVLDHHGTERLSQWFEDRWNERWALDISKDLADIIDNSWAREELVPPYHIYLNMAYHLSTEARAGLSQFRLPPRFDQELFEFQKSAVKIAARHLHRRGGVLIGDVVGLGKTIMATALARMFEDDLGYETLIICPKNLEPMWRHYRTEYGLRGQVLPISQVTKKLPDLKPYRLVLIDESHNLRNREGRRYKAIADYIRSIDAKVILLTATPYNKTKTDLSSQLRLFIDEKASIGIRPEHYMRKQGLSEAEFERKWQCKANSIVAIEKSDEFDDWRELIRLYMVRRTRSFILQHYTQADDSGRRFIAASDGERRYFPERQPHSLTFSIDEQDAGDRYARLYSDAVVDEINNLHVPRYGLGKYAELEAVKAATSAERKLIDNLGRAGKRLMGFCRTNLFKRLESSGSSFLQSIERHVLRNEIYLYAIQQGLDLPLGVLDPGVLDADRVDEDAEGIEGEPEDLLDGVVEAVIDEEASASGFAQAQVIYRQYAGAYKKRFKWISPKLFKPSLAEDLAEDTDRLRGIMNTYGPWQATGDRKLAELLDLVATRHGKDKVLVFTQFADTARYLERELRRAGVKQIDVATGASADPYALACRFSPDSNRAQVKKADELRVLVCTDVLSEGQNLQDCNVVVNFDLPWAIIRLIQRAGRVDRIGQRAERIHCYSFLPAEGVERLIRLRERIQQRLTENAEVVGTDEAFFEEDEVQVIRDLYTEKSGVLDDADDEVDLASYAWQIWKEATQDDAELARAVESLPAVVYSAKQFSLDAQRAPSLDAVAAKGGALVYVKSPEGNDHLAWIGQQGNIVTESQFLILKAAECSAVTPAQPRAENHHELVAQGLQLAVSQDKSVGGGLGRPSSPRRRAYERMKSYAQTQRGTLFSDAVLETALDDIYRHPLLETAADLLNRLLRSGVNDEELAEAVKTLREEGRLTYTEEDAALREPRIVCSLGLIEEH